MLLLGTLCFYDAREGGFRELENPTAQCCQVGGEPPGHTGVTPQLSFHAPAERITSQRAVVFCERCLVSDGRKL